MLELSRPSALETDADVAGAIAREEGRQRNAIELIASENFVSAAVLEAVGSVLTNKYAEGYPGKRYYGGCEYVDQVERLAIDRAKQLLALGMPTCSRILAPMPISRSTWRFWDLETGY